MHTIKKTNEYITFTLDGEVYAIEVSGIESILEYQKLTKLPGADDSVKGVLNLRGKALPVIDLRTVFNLKESGMTSDTSIIVMIVEGESSSRTVGGLVDSVKEVIEILPEMIQEAPKVGIKIDTDLISGIAGINNDFIIVLDIDKVFSRNILSTADRDDLLPSGDSEEVDVVDF